jgi:hypothetical protein
VLDVPAAYFYAVDDLLAALILAADRASHADKRKLIRKLATIRSS